MYCTQCGTQIRDNAKFCKQCGSPTRNFASARGSYSLSTSDLIQRAKKKLLDVTTPKVDKIRQSTSERLDKYVTDLKNPSQNSILSNSQRERLVRSLTSLKLKISKDGVNTEPKITEEEALEIVEITEELMAQIREDNCPICFKSLSPLSGKVEVSICPNCGHGGHLNHFNPWIQEKNTCPFCKTKVNTKNLVQLTIQ